MAIGDQLNGDNNGENNENNQNNNQNNDNNQNNQNSGGDNQGHQNNGSDDLVLNADLQSLVGPGKKYSTVQAALDSIPHAQTHISTLEKAKAEQAKEGEKNNLTTADLDAAIAKLTLQKTADTQTDGGMSKEDVAKLVAESVPGVINANAAQTLAENNSNQFIKALKDKFGEGTQKTWYAKIAEMGITEEAADQLVAQSPDFMMKQFALDKSDAAPNFTGSKENTGAQQQTSAKEWSAEWCNHIRRTDPKRYASQDFQYNMVIKR